METQPVLKQLRFAHVVSISILIRIGAVLYSEQHDKHHTLKYTDIDYHVFTDAARYLLYPTPAGIGEAENVAQGPLGRALGFGE